MSCASLQPYFGMGESVLPKDNRPEGGDSNWNRRACGDLRVWSASAVLHVYLWELEMYFEFPPEDGPRPQEPCPYGGGVQVEPPSNFYRSLASQEPEHDLLKLWR